jgi:hypothetical protein
MQQDQDLDVHGRAKSTIGLKMNLGDSLCAFLETTELGSSSIQLGAHALESSGCNNVAFSEINHIIFSAISALRQDENSDQKAEIVLAAIATWALVEDLSSDLRLSLASLVEACSSTIDQQYSGLSANAF